MRKVKDLERSIDDQLWGIYLEFKFGFAETLSFLIEQSAFSKKDLALKLDVHPSAISHWLRGSRLPSTSALYILTKVLALDAEHRSMLIALWHLSLLADHLVGYYEIALENKDEKAARQIFADLLQQDWGEFFPKEWKEGSLSVVQPDAFQFMQSNDKVPQGDKFFSTPKP